MSRMPKALFLLPALPFLFLGLTHRPPGVAVPPAAAATTEGGSGHFSATDQNVHVYDLAGHVELVPGTGTAVQVNARFGGADAGQLAVANLTKDGTAIVVKFPSDHIRWRSNGRGSSTSVEVNDDGTFRDHDGGWNWSGHRVRIDDRAGGLDAWADLRISVPRGQNLDVHLGVGHATVTNVDGNLVVYCSASDVAVNGARGRIKIATGSGDIEAHDVDAEQIFDTGSGTLRATHLTGPAIKVMTGSGEVTVAGVDAPKLRAQTGSGDMSLAAVTSDELVLGTGSGNVSVALTKRVRTLKVQTGSGEVRIKAPKDLGAAVRVQTGSGDVESTFPLANVRRGGGQFAGVIGDGRGDIDVQTGSGDVTLEQL